MSLKDDIVNESVVDLNIDGKPGFKYKPVTAGEENDWIPQYMVKKGDQYVQDFAMINKCKIQNLVGVPYTKEEIKEFFNIDKDWKNLTHEEKWKIIRKLKTGLFDKIIKAINKIDQPSKKKD